MEMIIDFPGGSRVDAHFNGLTVPTDQPPASSAPTPFATFLASIGTCAGIYVLGFCQQRGIATDGIRLVQRVTATDDPHGGQDRSGNSGPTRLPDKSRFADPFRRLCAVETSRKPAVGIHPKWKSLLPEPRRKKKNSLPVSL
jgi:hypothetical protein